MRKYLVLFNHNSKYQDNYAEIEALNKEEALVSALLTFGNFVVSSVMPADTHGYYFVTFWRKTKLQT